MTKALTAGAALLALAVACKGINAQTNSYATLDEARQAGAIARGWLPDGLPPGTHDIREAHVPGTRDRWGIVNFPPPEAEALRAILEPGETELGGVRCEPPARIEWWPLGLRGALDAERLRTIRLQSYRARTGDLLFAVNWSQGRAYYWTPAR